MQFYPIEDHSWVAIDIHHNLGEQTTLSNNKAGSMSCRQLLKKLQQALNVTGITLKP